MVEAMLPCWSLRALLLCLRLFCVVKSVCVASGLVFLDGSIACVSGWGRKMYKTQIKQMCKNLRGSLQGGESEVGITLLTSFLF